MDRERVVVGYDGSEAADRALAVAVSLPDNKERVVRVVTAWSAGDRGPAELAAERARLVELQHAAIVAALNPVAAQARPVVTSEIVMADPVTALADAADLADLVVIGGRQRQGPSGGTLSRELTQRLRDRPRRFGGPCPLIVVAATTEIPAASPSVLFPAVA